MHLNNCILLKGLYSFQTLFLTSDSQPFNYISIEIFQAFITVFFDNYGSKLMKIENIISQKITILNRKND